MEHEIYSCAPFLPENKMVETDIGKRWEKGIDHHPKSKKLYREIATLDFKYGGDRFCFKSGGDGDNGEHLMYLLDIYYYKLDEEFHENN